MTAYYNEIDTFAAQWLRNLISAGHIAPGDVDTRSIEDVTPDELKPYTQCHFFAGIGGWPLALRSAGWSDARPIWTGSCPCQPFSTSGKGAGFADERHLWPAFHHLIRECRPGVIFGEQVASAVDWLDLVSSDLEAEGYAFGATVLGAHSVGAPHQRQRIYWLANANQHRREAPSRRELHNQEYNAESCGSVGNAMPAGLPLRESETVLRARGGHEGRATEQPGGASSFWSDAEWIECRDGKKRPVKPGIFPLAYGFPECLGAMRAAITYAKQGVINYASASQTNPCEILRMVRDCLCSDKSGEKERLGVCFQFPAPEILLPFLLCVESACSANTKPSGIAQAGTPIDREELLSLWGGQRTVGSSSGREPDEQRVVKSSDAVFELAFLLARLADAHGNASWSADAATNRVGKLRASGNAIVPQIAEEFVRAFMEGQE